MGEVLSQAVELDQIESAIRSGVPTDETNNITITFQLALRPRKM
jgi:hypothetical protein